VFASPKDNFESIDLRPIISSTDLDIVAWIVLLGGS